MAVPYPLLMLQKRLGGEELGQRVWAKFLPQGVAAQIASSNELEGGRAAARGRYSRRPSADSQLSTEADSTASSEEEEVNPGDNEEERSVLGHVWELSQDAAGCRRVQSALENEEECLAVTKELKGRVWEALRCPHANYVLQKCITTLGPEGFHFVYEELTSEEDGPITAAHHKYGCRIVKRLLEFGCPEQVQGLMDAFLADICKASMHLYGTFVVQHMLEHGEESQKQRLLREMEAHVNRLCRDAHACAAVHAALRHGGGPARVAVLCLRIVQEPGLLAAMGCLRYGHRTVSELMAMLQGEDLRMARRELCSHMSTLRASRYGRQVVSALELNIGPTSRKHAP